MPKKASKQAKKRLKAMQKAPIGDPTDPRSIINYRNRYLEWMRVSNYSEQTLTNRSKYINLFMQWAEDRGIQRANEVTKPILDRYQRHLYHYRKPNGKPLSFRAQHSRLVPLRAFFKWLTKNNYILYNPASELELPKLEKRLPKHVLSIPEVETVLNTPDTATDLGIRDRAILEVLYSTGMRRMELVRLQLYDLDTERGTIMVRQGKGKKDRMIPIGERAIQWIDKYVLDVRPSLVSPPDDGTLFLTHTGEPFTPGRMTQLVRNYVDASKIGKKGACHLFRHTMATLMLENGADIRFIQQMLGHAELSTTQIYTQVSIKKLKEIHTFTHPGSRLHRESKDREPLNPK